MALFLFPFLHNYIDLTADGPVHAQTVFVATHLSNRCIVLTVTPNLTFLKFILQIIV